MNKLWEDNDEIKRFREYLRIPSVHPDINYEPCLVFLKEQAKALNLPFRTYKIADPAKPIFVITWSGNEPNLPSIMLNSHMDVVPVFEEHWTHPPFSAHMDDEGKIYARGSQDMKCVGMQYLAAIRSLQNDGIKLKRTIHVVFMPDEETGGDLGMKIFVKSPEFQNLNIGFSLDEGYASATNTYAVFYAERSIWQMIFYINGTPGHGSLLLENTAGAKLTYLLNKMYQFRDEESMKLNQNSNLRIGDISTINLTQINGGVQFNVVPPIITAGFDIRLAIDVNHDKFETQLKKWCEEAGGNIAIKFIIKEESIPPTQINSSNIFWVELQKSFNEMKLEIKTQVFPGGTDSTYLRAVGIPAIGFSPMNNTPVLLHDHNEYLKADTYLEGIKIYKNIIPKLANA